MLNDASEIRRHRGRTSMRRRRNSACQTCASKEMACFSQLTTYRGQVDPYFQSRTIFSEKNGLFLLEYQYPGPLFFTGLKFL